MTDPVWLSIPQAVALTGRCRSTLFQWMTRQVVVWRVVAPERGGVRRAREIERESLRQAVRIIRS